MNLQKRTKLWLFLPLFVMSSELIAGDKNTTTNTKANSNKASDIYRNVNEDGVVEFSDQSLSNSKIIKLKSINSFKPAEKKETPEVTQSESSSEAPLLKGLVKYTQLSISSPTVDQQIRSNDGLLTVSLSINPALNVASGDQVELYFDGRSQGKQQNTVFNLKDVFRGQHRIQAKVLNKNGDVLKTSKAIQFVIIKFSVLFNKKPAAPPPVAP